MKLTGRGNPIRVESSGEGAGGVTGRRQTELVPYKGGYLIMQTFTLSGNDFFDRVSYPVLLAQGQSVQYFNQAAAELFRLQATPLAEGSPVPEPLEIQRGAGISARRLAGEEWVITSREVDAGTLYLLHQEQGEDSRSRIWLHQLAERMRGPMASMTAAIQVLERSLVETERLRNERYLALLQKSYYRMLRLAGNVETLCQLEDGGAEQWYTPQVFDLAGLCRKLHRETDLLVESVGAQLSYQEDQSSVLVKGEEQLLSTLIYHLIANALYCLKGKGGEICLKLSRHGSQVLVTVEDNGGGMEERELMTAFEPESNESGLKPVGLGLTICRKIATLHGGALMLTSGKQGTRVTLSLPVDDGREAPALRSRTVDYTGGFPPALVALSDLLPESFFVSEEQE